MREFERYSVFELIYAEIQLYPPCSVTQEKPERLQFARKNKHRTTFYLFLAICTHAGVIDDIRPGIAIVWGRRQEGEIKIRNYTEVDSYKREQFLRTRFGDFRSEVQGGCIQFQL